MSNAPIEIIGKLVERKNQPVERVPHGTGTATATPQLFDITSVPLERPEQRNSLALLRSRFLSSKRSGTSNTSNDFPGSEAGYPSSHPHADRPNWRPAETGDDYLRNCQEGLEQYSERRMASLLGLPRMKLWQMRMMAAIPEGLFERLVRSRPRTKALAQIGALLAGNTPQTDVEHCPCCGCVLRTRGVRPDLVTIVNEWRSENEQDA